MVFKQFQVWEWVQKSESFGPESGIIYRETDQWYEDRVGKKINLG